MADIRLKDIREQYIVPALQGKPYRFKVFSNAGAYRKTVLENKIRRGVINALLEVTDSDIILLGGGLKASALNVTLTFLVPVPDEATSDKSADYGGNYTFLDDFRDMLTDTFATTGKTTISSGGFTYTGGVTATFPLLGEYLQRQQIGKSIEYVCYLQFTYLKGGVNASDVQFYLDGDETAIPYTSFSIARKNTVAAALLSNANNGEATAYAESSNFAVDLSLPAILPTASNITGTVIFNFLMGFDDGNTPHTLKINYAGNESTKTVIFSEASNEGSGVENVAARISFIPYMPAENLNA